MANSTDSTVEEYIMEPYGSRALAFCEEVDNLTRHYEKGILGNECYINGLGLLSHVVFVMIVIPIHIVLRKSYLGEISVKTWIHYPGHDVRWLLTMVLIALNIIEIAEGCISNYMYVGMKMHLIVPPILGILGSAFSICFYHHAEMWNSPKFLIILALYWLCSCLIKVLKLINLLNVGLWLQHLRLDVTMCLFGVYVSLLFVEMHVFIKVRYTLFRESKLLRPPDELLHTNYLQNYVNLASKATFWWVYKLLKHGFRQPIHLTDLGTLPSVEHAATNFRKFRHNYRSQLIKLKKSGAEDMKPCLWRCYAQTFWPNMTIAGFSKLCGDLLCFMGPICMVGIIHYVELKVGTIDAPSEPLPEKKQYITVSGFFSNGFVLAVVMFASTILMNTLLQTHHHLVIREAIRCRAALQSLVYGKTLCLSAYTLTSGQMTQGEILNHMSVDAASIQFFFYLFHYSWITPIKIAVSLVMLYYQLGYSALIGASLIILCTPVQYFISKWYTKIQKKTLECSDLRMKKCNELFQGMKLLKLYAWESIYCDNIHSVRAKQLRLLLKGALLNAVLTFITEGAPIIVTLVSYTLYPYMENKPLTAAKAFSALALFHIVGMPLFILPHLAKNTVNAIISTKRLSNYLLAQEVEKKQIQMDDYSEVEFTIEGSPHVSFRGLPGQASTSGVPKSGSLHSKDQLTPSTSMHRAPSTSSLTAIEEAEEQSLSSVSNGGPKSQASLDAQGRKTSLQSQVSSEASLPVKKISLPVPIVTEVHSDTPTAITQVADKSASDLSSLEINLDPVETDTLLVKDDPKLSPSSSRASPSSRKGSDTSSISKPDNLQIKATYTKDGEKRGSRSASVVSAISGIFKDGKRISNASIISCSSFEGFLEGPILEIHDGTFSWSPYPGMEDLKNINVRVEAGKLTVIVGSVGCGKSSLLSAMLGEMRTKNGSIYWRQGITSAYCAQTPWLLNTTLRENILFGSPYNKKRFKAVIKACALQPDIDILPAGEFTEIGEKGINLSGGQKHRVSLARALYSSADVVLMDDPFSALDVHVGAHVFDEGVLRFLLRKKRSVVLVTHHLQFLAFADMIYRMSHGIITHFGTLQEIKHKDKDLFTQWQNSVIQSKHSSESRSEGEEDQEKSAAAERKMLKRRISNMDFQRQSTQALVPPISQLGSTSQEQLDQSLIHKYVLHGTDVTEITLDADLIDDGGAKNNMSRCRSVSSETWPPIVNDKDDSLLEKGHLMKEEERETGAISWRVWLTYISACSWGLACIVFTSHVLRTASLMTTDYWLNIWSSAATALVNVSRRANNVSANFTQEPEMADVTFYVNIYALLCCISIVLSLLVSFTSKIAGLLASKRLHRAMLDNIVLAPMKFFDTTPVGRILNRFSGDTNTIDERLPSVMESWIRVSFLCISALIINTVITPFFILPALPFIIIYYLLQRFFRSSSRELQRLDSITKSPVFAHFSETLSGLSTIRAYKVDKRFQDSMFEKIDCNNCAFLWLNTANRWLGVRLDHLGACIVLTAALTSLIAGIMGKISTGMVGLAISYALMMCGYLNWVVRDFTDTEMQMNAVERMDYYTNVETEHTLDPVKVDKLWPFNGAVTLNKLFLRYSEKLEPVIKGVSLHIKAGEKIGICGRTGSGKSSLTLGLFRLIDICGGHILIDNVDITKVPLAKLRSRLAIIPQDPILFAGTVRYNLDPKGAHDDKTLWEALEVAQLKPIVQASELGLDCVISEGGDNFSVGQRQLFCLARAFLRRSKILVMDEATSSIDLETDKVVQEVILKIFRDTTVITIAHRISTILKSSRVIVLEEGNVVEHGSPKHLLKKTNGKFAALVSGKKPNEKS